jgi:malonyl CoA-acyl carrier protein transacylase
MVSKGEKTFEQEGEKMLEQELRKLLNSSMDRVREVLKTVSLKNFEYAGELRVQNAAIKIGDEAFPDVTEKLHWLVEEAEEQLTDIVVKTKFWLEMLSKLKVELRKTKMR